MRLTIAFVALIPTLLSAQADTAVVTVRVVSPLGLSVPLADVSIRRGDTVVARAQADSAGQARLVVPRATAAAILVRRLGYKPASQPLPYPLERTNSVVVLLAEDEPAVLDTVRVNSRESIRVRKYFIDSSAIATSPVRIENAWDVLKYLRPDAAFGRGADYGCPGVEEVFINGEWVVPSTVLINPIVTARESRGGSSATPHLTRASSPRATIGHRVTAINALAMIKPEHIAQITFRDCRDKPIAGMHSTSAVFVVLKAGIAFDPATGSFPIRP
jgi:hypothetical protein